VEVAPSFDPEVPSIARTYDYLLGGKDNYPVDREVGEMFLQRFPDAVQIPRSNRACLVRAVRYLAEELGVDQYLDLGSGLPTSDNVHQVAQRANSAARVVYVDNDPQVLAHGRALLAENNVTTVIQADIRYPEALLAEHELRDMLDLSRPVALIASAVVHHFVDEDDPVGVMQRYRDATVPGSYLFISHFRSLGDPESRELEEIHRGAFGRGQWRTDAEIAAFFGDMTLIDPGIVPCTRWRPDRTVDPLTPWQRLIVAGLGAK